MAYPDPAPSRASRRRPHYCGSREGRGQNRPLGLDAPGAKWSISQITVGLRHQEQGHTRLARVPTAEALVAASLLANRCRRSNRSYLVNLQANGFGSLFVSSSYNFIRNSSSCKFAESFGVRTFLCNREKYTSTWLSQLACTGRCTRMALG